MSAALAVAAVRQGAERALAAAVRDVRESHQE
jgi:hypothetical protein